MKIIKLSFQPIWDSWLREPFAGLVNEWKNNLIMAILINGSNPNSPRKLLLLLTTLLCYLMYHTARDGVI